MADEIEAPAEAAVEAPAETADAPVKRGPGRPPKVPVERKPVKLLADYWPADPAAQALADPLGKVPAGTVLDIEVNEARAIVGDGRAERADPF